MVEDDHLLAVRLRAVASWDDDSDWDAVQTQATKLARSPTASRGRWTLLIAAAALLAVVTPAIAFRHQLVDLFSANKPAPLPVKRSFAMLDRSAPPGMAPHVKAGLARVVLRRSIGNNATVITWAAPTEHGGFCTETAIATPSKPHPTSGGGGCDAERTLRLAPQIQGSGPMTTTGGGRAPAMHGIVVFSGDTLIPEAASITLVYQDGSHARIPLTWISKPINAAFFAYRIPSNHSRVGHTPAVIQVEDKDGRTLLTDRTFFGQHPFPNLS